MISITQIAYALMEWISQITNTFDMFSFEIGGMQVTLFEIFLGFIAISLIVAVFWKGARV